MHTRSISLATLGAGLLAAVPVHAQEQAAPPEPTAAVKRACDAAGGLDAFKSLGIVELRIKREEVTQDGKVIDSAKKLFFLAPGPTPGRTEEPQFKVVAGDDGTGGWALMGDKPDSRPSTNYMVKRLLTTDLFPLMLPFSLTWEGVTVASVAPADLGGVPVWRLQVQLSPTFFHTPQISRAWTVDIARHTSALVRAVSPATDLGKGVTADGMQFTWGEVTRVRGVALPQYERVVGLDPYGREKSHSRIDRISYDLVPRADAAKLFANPIPPDQRPKMPGLQPPPPPAGAPGT
jgi:hypothetical protein